MNINHSDRFFAILLLIMVSILHASLSIAYAGTSVLWGKHGELWKGPSSRLPDYSYAGYHYGEINIPDVPVTLNVKDFGAMGDGVTDDTVAFKKAIAQLDHGALFIPEGRYVLSDLLVVRKSNIVIRGAGQEKTSLFFLKDMYESVGYDPSTGDPIPGKVENASWGVGGEFLITPPSKNDGENSARLADIKPAQRGDSIIYLENMKGEIKTGDWVVLKLTDNSPENDLRKHVTIMTEDMDEDEVIESGIIKNRRLYWPVKVREISGNRLTLWQPLKNDIRRAWQPEIRKYVWLKEVGIEDLTIDFPPSRHKVHGHFKGDSTYDEKVYNGLSLEGLLNGWVRNVTIQNVQNGIDIDELTSHVTLRNIKIIGKKYGAYRTYNTLRPYGHHGLGFNGSQDCLVEYCEIPKSFRHDITVYHMASGNVARKCIGEHISIDHHTRFPYGNLFSDIYVGAEKAKDSYRYSTWSFSGGPDNTGPKSAAWETFWNIKSFYWNAPDAEKYLPYKEFHFANVIPSLTEDFSHGRHYESINGKIEPEDLYASQLARRGFKAYTRPKRQIQPIQQSNRAK